MVHYSLALTPSVGIVQSVSPFRETGRNAPLDPGCRIFFARNGILSARKCSNRGNCPSQVNAWIRYPKGITAPGTRNRSRGLA